MNLKTKRSKVLERLNKLTKNSTLIKDETIAFGQKINRGIAKKHGILSEADLESIKEAENELKSNKTKRLE